MSKARDLANGATALSAVSATELGYVDGVTSAIQTQMDAKTALLKKLGISQEEATLLLS